jgi:hypothetical protein
MERPVIETVSPRLPVDERDPVGPVGPVGAVSLGLVHAVPSKSLGADNLAPLPPIRS